MATENKNIRGLEVLIYVNVAEEGQTPKYEPVGGQRGASLSMSADELDITDKNTVGYKKFLVGLKEWSISCDGLVVDGETAYDALFKAFIGGDIVHIQLKKEELEAERDLYEFKRDVEKQAKGIADLERRIASLSGSTNASDIAERRRLEAD
jgi:TP901-1 family phage major tail protein